ncbi:MAG: nitrilase-related carbon-nitrogen hydrolase, partial [Rhodospirillales bacterium]
MTFRVACLQLCSGPEPEANTARAVALIGQAADEGADLVTLPEVTNIIQPNRQALRIIAKAEADDPTLAALREAARAIERTVLVGSLVLKAEDDDQERLVNRSFLLGPDGSIRARYDKIHLFDVELPGGESYRESASYRAGHRRVL